MKKNTAIKILEDLTTHLLKQNQKYLDIKMHNNEWFLISLKKDKQFYLECINNFINHCLEDFIESIEYTFGYRHFWMERKEIINYFNEYIKNQIHVMFINTFNHWYQEYEGHSVENEKDKNTEPQIHYINEDEISIWNPNIKLVKTPELELLPNLEELSTRKEK